MKTDLQRREEFLERLSRGERLSETETGDLARLMASLAGTTHARETKHGLLIARLVALVFLAILVWFVPVTVWRCEATGAGAAVCAVEGTRGGMAVIGVENVDGVARAETTPDRYGIRFYNRADNLVFEREESAVAGTRMTTLARQVQALADGSRTAPVVARQWPLVIAIVATLVLVFVLSGLGALHRRVTGSTQRSSPRFASLLFGLGATAVGLGVAWLAPLVVYSCGPGEAGAACAVEQRLAGFVLVDRFEVTGIANANGRSWTKTWTSTENGKTKHHSESMSEIELVAADGRVLYADEQSGAIGTGAEAIAERIGALAERTDTRPFVVWQMPWLPALFASIALLFGVPTLLTLAVGLKPALRDGPAVTAVWVLALVAVVGGWALALMGRFG